MGSRTGRREFLGQVVAGAASLGVVRGAEAALTRAAAPSVVPGSGARPAGDLKRRVDLTAARLTRTGIPAYTDEFVLADVTLDERRRFWNFSGDLSGRYIEALSVLPPDGRTPGSLAPLVRKLLATQKADGRFGRPGLAFTEADTGTEHMALLWGNGRLLVGLMTYYEVTRDRAVLESARRLAGFLLAVREATKAPAVMKRVEGQGAFGFICFTQLSEGLAMLSRATGEKRYAEAGAEIVPLLQPRGVQHSHGYLSTLRGAVMLHDAGAPGDMLGFAQRLYGDLVRSGDYTLDGGVMEYFGWTDPANRALLAPAQDASGHDARNEGCGLADFVRLSLQLYEATGQLDYLERAERCLVNGFDQNQFDNGDFGSRVFFEHGIKPTPSVDRAWWCCTMHGYRAYRDLLDHAVVEKNGVLRVQLFEDVDFGGTHAALTVRRTPFGVECRLARPFDGTFALRQPSWASRTEPVPQRKIARGLRRGGIPPRPTEVRQGRHDLRAVRLPVALPGPGRTGRRTRAIGSGADPGSALLRALADGRRRGHRPVLLRRAVARERRHACRGNDAGSVEGRSRPPLRELRARWFPRRDARDVASDGRDAGRRTEDARLGAQLPPRSGRRVARRVRCAGERRWNADTDALQPLDVGSWPLGRRLPTALRVYTPTIGCPARGLLASTVEQGAAGRSSRCRPGLRNR